MTNRNDRGIDDFTRHLAIAALSVVAVTHFSDLPDKIEEAPYLALLFALNIGLSLGLVYLLMMRRVEPAVLSAAGLLALGTLAAYVVSRSIGLPQIEDHVGHWLEPGGVAAALAEITLVGLAIPTLARAPHRLAAFVAVPMVTFVGVAIAAGQEFEGHASGHEHGAQAAHAHGTAAGPSYPDVAAASEEDRQKAGRLLDAVWASAKNRFPSYNAARRLRYKSKLTPPSLFHVRNREYQRDARALDPSRPESLVYWLPQKGGPILVGMMFRSRTGRAPTDGGGLLPWHGHKSRTSGRPGATVMTHVWLTGDTRSALAHCFPADAIERANPRFRYSEPGSGRAGGSPPCPPGN